MRLNFKEFNLNHLTMFFIVHIKSPLMWFLGLRKLKKGWNLANCSCFAGCIVKKLFFYHGREVLWKLTVTSATLLHRCFWGFGHIFSTCSKKFTKMLKVGNIFRCVTFYQHFFASDKTYYKTNSGSLYN